jgi:hypothetical protein
MSSEKHRVYSYEQTATSAPDSTAEMRAVAAEQKACTAMAALKETETLCAAAQDIAEKKAFEQVTPTPQLLAQH